MRLFLVCVICLTMGSSAFGQDAKTLSFSSTPIWAAGTKNSGGDGNARWLDVDRDGDLDLVTSLPNPRRWVLFANEDGRLGSKPVWESKTTTDCDHISVLDYNRDGWPDLAGTHESHCTLYLHRGEQTKDWFPRAPQWETASYTDANQIDFGDFDQDGDWDMLMASGLPVYQLALFTAGKTGLPETRPTQRIGPREYSESAIFADYDSDGDLDVIATYGKRGTAWAFTNQDGRFDDGREIYRDTTAPWCQRIYCLDFDGDGQQELFLAKGPWGPPAASVQLVRERDGYRVAWQSAKDTGYHGFDFQDVDGDGDLDLAAADWAGRRVAIYLQDRGQLPPAPSWSAATSGPNHEVMWGDMDGDGDLDLAVGGVDQAQVFANLREESKP